MLVPAPCNNLIDILFPAVQGAGGGAIQSLSSIVVSDMVTLKERGLYNAMIGG